MAREAGRVQESVHCLYTPAVESMLLGGGFPVAMLGGYLDDSSDGKRAQHYSFGGIVGDIRQIEAFSIAWISATSHLKKPFHTTDCESGGGQFKGWDKRNRVALMTELVDLIKKLKVWGFAAVVSVQDYRLAFPNAGPKDPFFLCVKSAIAGLAYIADEVGQNIDMWFEEGDDDGKIQEIHREFKKLPNWKQGRRLLGITGRDKNFVPLQAADLYAREAFKHFNNFGLLPERKPLTRLKPQLMFHCWTLPALTELKKLGGPDKLELFATLEIGGHSLIG